MPERSVAAGSEGVRCSILPPRRRRTRRHGGAVLIDEIAAFLDSQPLDLVPKARSSDETAKPCLLLPYSGSELAEQSLEAMIELAPVLHSRVRVLLVREFDRSRAGTIPVMSRFDALALTREAVVHLRRAGIATTGVVRAASRTDVAKAIVTEATASQCAMILIAMRRRRSIADLLRPNTARRVLRRAECPVLVVHSNRGSPGVKPG